MENLLLKLRLIFWPFVRLVLLVAGGYAVVWAALVWLFGATLGVQLRAEIAFQFWFLPLMGAIAVALGLRPRIHLLEAGRKDGWRAPFYYLAVIAIALAAGNAASAVQEILLQPVSLRDASEVSRYPANSAFMLRHIYLARNQTVFEELSGSGKSGRYLTIYAATPIFRYAADTSNGPAIAWIGTVFRSSNNPDTASGEDFDGFLRFRKSVAATVRTPSAPDFTYLLRIERLEALLAAVRRSPLANKKKLPILLEARFNSFANRADESLKTLRLVLEWGFGLFLGLLLFPRLHAGRLQEYRATGRFSTNGELGGWLAPVRPQPGFYVVPLLIGLNTIVFLIMTAAGLGMLNVDAPDLIKWGAAYGSVGPPNTWWRLVISLWLQDGILHFLNAAWALGWVGWHLEKEVGKRWLAGVYVTAALVAALVSLWWQPRELAVGAAGGVLGLYGFGLALLWRSNPLRGINLEMLATLGVTFAVVEMIIGLASDRINWAMLVGGAVTGLLLGAGKKPKVVRNS